MIIDLQRRMRQLGEIRIGRVVEGVSKQGKAYTRPEKMSEFRFTSPSREILEGVAAKYGGTVQPWTPANGGPSEFEVVTEVNRLPVIIPPGAVEQWYELYGGSVCTRRCNGHTEQKSDRPCMCDPDKRDCSLTTRVNVILQDVGPLGAWLLTTRGYYAAIELPAVADLLAKGGGHIPGWLGLEERRVVREKPGGGTETLRFMVPTLDIDLVPGQLPGFVAAAAVAGRDPVAALGAADPVAQIEAAKADDGAGLWAEIQSLQSGEGLTALWRRLIADPPTGLDVEQVKAWMKARADEIDAARESGEAVQSTGQPAGEPQDIDAAWDQCVLAAGRLDPPLGLTEVHQAFVGRYDRQPLEGTYADMISFRDWLRGGAK